jgi:hypothetical protein
MTTEEKIAARYAVARQHAATAMLHQGRLMQSVEAYPPLGDFHGLDARRTRGHR